MAFKRIAGRTAAFLAVAGVLAFLVCLFLGYPKLASSIVSGTLLASLNLYGSIAVPYYLLFGSPLSRHVGSRTGLATARPVSLLVLPEFFARLALTGAVFYYLGALSLIEARFSLVLFAGVLFLGLAITALGFVFRKGGWSART